MEEISLLIEFIEGKINPKDFIDILLCYEQLCDALKKEYMKQMENPDYDIITFIKDLNPQKKYHSEALYNIIENYLFWNDIKYNKVKIIY